MFREIFKTMASDVRRIEIPEVRDKIVVIVALLSFVIGGIASFFSLVGLILLIGGSDINMERLYTCIIISVVSWSIVWVASAYDRVKNGTNY